MPSFSFLSTLSLRRATTLHLVVFGSDCNFYPRSPCGERLEKVPADVFYQAFLSTLSLRRATIVKARAKRINRFLSTLSLRRATVSDNNLVMSFLFLSTLSLRRATLRYCRGFRSTANFYPRSPCGERRFTRCTPANNVNISIHALLAESD